MVNRRRVLEADGIACRNSVLVVGAIVTEVAHDVMRAGANGICRRDSRHYGDFADCGRSPGVTSAAGWPSIGCRSQEVLLQRLPLLSGYGTQDMEFSLIEKTPWENIERGLVVTLEESRRAPGLDFRLDYVGRRSHSKGRTSCLVYEGLSPNAR